jgi:predicted AAA+ superfamily ATPase
MRIGYVELRTRVLMVSMAGRDVNLSFNGHAANAEAFVESSVRRQILDASHERLGDMNRKLKESELAISSLRAPIFVTQPDTA